MGWNTSMHSFLDTWELLEMHYYSFVCTFLACFEISNPWDLVFSIFMFWREYEKCRWYQKPVITMEHGNTEKRFPTNMFIKEHEKGMTLSKQVLAKPLLSQPHSFTTPHILWGTVMNTNIFHEHDFFYVLKIIHMNWIKWTKMDWLWRLNHQKVFKINEGY